MNVHAKLQEMHDRREQGERGIGTVDILIYIAIVIVVLALAIPAIGSLRASANKSNVKQDIKSAATAMEESFTLNSTYPAEGAFPTALSYKNTTGVTVVIEKSTNANGGGFCLTATHANVGGYTARYDSATGKTTDDSTACSVVGASITTP